MIFRGVFLLRHIRADFFSATKLKGPLQKITQHRSVSDILKVQNALYSSAVTFDEILVGALKGNVFSSLSVCKDMRQCSQPNLKARENSDLKGLGLPGTRGDCRKKYRKISFDLFLLASPNPRRD
jgi:hypothetical protein